LLGWEAYSAGVIGEPSPGMETLEGVVAFAEGGAGPEIFTVWVVLLKYGIIVGIIIFCRHG
jgi:hypothetical protein